MSCPCHKTHPAKEQYEYVQNQPKVGPKGQPYTLQGKSSFKPAPTTEYYHQADYQRSKPPSDVEKKNDMWNGVG
jgi:hypothetical protein